MYGVAFWVALVAGTGGWYLGKSSGYESGYRDGLYGAPAYFAAETAERERAESLQHERDLAYAAAQPSMMMCLDLLGVDTTAIEEEVREDMIEDSMTEYDLRSEPY